jgi:hypothetical protein
MLVLCYSKYSVWNSVNYSLASSQSLRIQILPTACTRVTLAVLCVCVSVCYQATCSCYIPGLYVENNRLLMAFLRYVLCGFRWKRFVQKSYWPLLPSSLLNELSIDERDSNRFISVCRSSITRLTHYWSDTESIYAINAPTYPWNNQICLNQLFLKVNFVNLSFFLISRANSRLHWPLTLVSV